MFKIFEFAKTHKRKYQLKAQAANANKPTHSRTRGRCANRKFSCVQCGKSFTQKINLEYHYRIHTGLRPYTCTCCPKTFIQLIHLQQHVRIHLNLKPYRCECGQIFRQLNHLSTHQKLYKHKNMATTTTDTAADQQKQQFNVVDKKKEAADKKEKEDEEDTRRGLNFEPISWWWRCTICHILLQDKDRFMQHQNDKHPIGEQDAEDAEGRVIEEIDLASTDDEDDGDKSAPGVQRTMSTASTESIPYNTRFQRGPLTCCVCSETFAYQAALNCHLSEAHLSKRNEDGTIILTCGLCPKINPKVYKTRRQLLTHCWTHTKDRPFKCEKCDKGFIFQKTLEEHGRRCGGGEVQHSDVSNSKQL